MVRGGGGAGHAGKGLFAPIEKWLRKRISSSRRHHHVFKGEVRKGGQTWKAGGWHHRFGGQDMPDRRVTRINRRDVNGCYHADVEMKGPGGQWIRKGPGSTFFPDNWTPQEVDRTIDGAFRNGSPVPGTNNRRWRGFDNGVLVEGSYHPNGTTWNSGWPIVQ